MTKPQVPTVSDGTTVATVREHREARGMSQTELAKAMGLSKGQMSHLENGGRVLQLQIRLHMELLLATIPVTSSLHLVRDGGDGAVTTPLAA